MRAWRVHELGTAEYETDVSVPVIGSEDDDAVLLKVEAAGPNFADGLMIGGTYQERPDVPFTPGLEVAGVVVETRNERLQAGDRVVGTTRPGWGAWAEYAICDASHLVVIPDGVAMTDAVAFHVNAQTAWFGLHRRANLVSGESVLVNAAAGGVGTMAVQLAVAAGATVYATSSAKKLHIATGLGAAASVDNRAEGWPDLIREANDGRGIDVVVDMVGGDVFKQSWRLLAFEGRAVTVGFTSGDVPVVKANHALVKNVSLEGLYWGRYQDDAPELVQQAAVEIFDIHLAGKLDPCISALDTIDNALDRMQDIAEGRTTGKVVLTP